MPCEPESEYERNFDATIVQYLSGRLAEPARRAFEAWLHEVPSRWERVERLQAVWEASAEVPASPDTDIDAALAQVKERSQARRTAAVPDRPPLKLEPVLGGARRSSTARVVVWRIAAALVVLAGAGLLGRAARPDAAWRAQHPAEHRYTTSRGERATINLPDGSVVMLHNESSLEVPAGFGTRSRDVRLQGEGYFEVARDSSRPFQVHSGSSVTRVLGTKFDVRARSDEQAIQVAVLEGRVAVGARGIGPDAPVLTAGQVARLSEGGEVALQSDIDVRRLLSWTGGRMVFDHTPVPEVLVELGRWFDRDFVLGDSTLAQLKLTTVLGGQSLAEAVAVLETALDARATINDRQIVLTRP